MLNITSGKIGGLAEVPEIGLAASYHEDLSLVASPQPGSTNPPTKSLFAMGDGATKELVPCSGQGTLPPCSFALDESGIALQSTFAETSLVD